MIVSGEIFSGHQVDAQPVVNSAVLVNVTGLVLPYYANMAYPFAFEAFVPFSLAGVVSGYKFQLNDMVTGAVYSNLYFEVIDGTTGVVVQSGFTVTAVTTIQGALAVIGNHLLRIKGDILNGTTPLQLQFAQNVADPAAITVLPGAYIRGFFA